MAHAAAATDATVEDSAHAPYIKIFFALLFLTILEYFYAKIVAHHFFLLVLGLTAMALTKAALVALYFMHLKFEGNWVYLMIIPACVLAVMLVLALYPDIGMRPSSGEGAIDDEIEVRVEPPTPAFRLIAQR